MASDRWTILKAALLLAALAEIASSFLPMLGVGAEMSERSAAVQNTLTPAGYAFAIWGLIYLAILLFALVFAWRPAAEAGVARWLAIAAAANASWATYAQFAGILPLTIAIIVIGWGAALAALFTTRPERAGPTAILGQASAGLLAGWLTVATGANITAVWAGSGAGYEPLGEPGVALAVALVFGLIALLIAWRSASLWYAAAAAWGFAAITVANMDSDGPLRLAMIGAPALIALTLIAVAGLARASRSNRRSG